MEALEAYMKDADDVYAKRLESLEKEADELRRVLIDELNRTFITPIDREDLFALSRTIDDVLDYGYTTLDEMVTLGVKPNVYLQRLVGILREAAEELYLGVIQLKDHPQVALDHAGRAKQLENRVESVYRSAIADLFKEPKTVEDIVAILKVRETYRHLSNAADRGDEAANIIGDIVVKMT
ncbi:MAG: DUF47 family protein [Chloroflexi bacterium]|nr:DUF47 family protein [Chloroflexota bacterium]